jgi:hypothetical protein
MTDRDEIADLADRLRAKQRRGEDVEFEFEIEWGALTDDEREEFIALLNERIAHGEERLEAIEESNRILRLLLAYKEGAITAREFVEAVRGAVPDPLARPT